MVMLEGFVEQFCCVFDMYLYCVVYGDCEYCGCLGLLWLLELLQDVVVVVLGLDLCLQVVLYFCFVLLFIGLVELGGIWFVCVVFIVLYMLVQFVQFYGFLQGDGVGQCIVFVEFGGGYWEDDLCVYFQEVGVLMLMVMVILVGLGVNCLIGDLSGLDGEVMFDLEVVGVVVLGVMLVVYFIVNIDVGFV